MPLQSREQPVMEALLVLTALILAVGPVPVSAVCQGSVLSTLFPNIDWSPTCLTATFRVGVIGEDRCQGYGTPETVCYNNEFLAMCKAGEPAGAPDFWELQLDFGGSCQGCSTTPDANLLPANAQWGCNPGFTTPVPVEGVCSGVCTNGYTANGGISATCKLGDGREYWSETSGTLQCNPTVSGCSSTALPPPPTNAGWVCESSTPSGSTCSSGCMFGYAAASADRVTILCSGGQWTSQTGTITCVSTSCTTTGLPALPANAVWNCPGATPSGITCTSDCASGYIASSTATTLCQFGIWGGLTGTATCSLPESGCSPGNIPPIQDGTATWPTDCSSGTTALPSRVTCTSTCNDGYTAAAGSTPPQTQCLNGTWQTVTGSCTPKGCNGNPGASLVANATWNCATTPHTGNCTGACNGGDGGANPPVATCDKGTWTYLAGACQPGSKVRYLTIEAPNDFSADFMKYFNEGRAVEWINAHIEETKAGYKYFIPAILWPYVETQLGIANVWSTDPAKFVSSNRRRLLAEQGKQAITLGFQLTGSSDGGFLSSVVDATIDKVLQSRIVLVGLTGFIVRQAELLQEPYPGYDYSTVAIGFSDPAGVIETPVTPVDCNLFLDANVSSYSPETFRQNLPAPVEQKLLANQASVCMGVPTIKATFPVVAPHPENIEGQVALSAVVKRPGPNPVDVSGFTCQVTPGSVPGTTTNYSSQYTVDITCKKSDGSRFSSPNSYLIVLLGSFSCNAANLTSSASFQVVVAAGPQVTTRVTQRPASVCSSGRIATAEFNYTLNAAAGSAVSGQWDVRGTATTRNVAADCTVKVTPSSSTTGKALVTCTGTFTATNNIKVQLSLTATQGDCTSAGGTASTSIPVLCCAIGASYARQTTGTSGSVPCIRHVTPNTPPRRCTKNTYSNGYVNNKGPGQATLYFAPSKEQCPSRTIVATVTVACAGTNALAFTLKTTARRAIGNKGFVYVGCNKVQTNEACPGVSWLKVGGQQALATNTVEAGGAQVVQFNATISAGASCNCSSAYWAVYAAGTFTGLPRAICTA